jgi:hypothetical protein
MVKIKYNLSTISIYLKYIKNKINLNYNYGPVQKDLHLKQIANKKNYNM